MTRPRVLIVLLLLTLGVGLWLGRPSEVRLASDPIGALALPVLAHGEHPVEHWVDRLREGGRGARVALWCLYYANDHSPEVVDFLRAELERQREEIGQHPEIPRSDTLHREIDAVFDDWGCEHECLTIEEYWDERMARAGDRFAKQNEVFALPADRLFSADDKLLALLDSPIRHLSTTAAVNLIARQSGIEAAVRSLLRQLHRYEVVSDHPFWSISDFDGWEENDALAIRAVRWAREFAGTRAEVALAGLLADPEEPIEVKRFLLDRVGLRSLSQREIRDEETLPSVLVELARGGPLAASARRELFRIGEVSCELGEGFLDWGISFLSRHCNGGFRSCHCHAAASVLVKLGLSEEQQAALTWTFAEVPYERRDGALALHERTGIERVVDMRRKLYQGDLEQVRSIHRYSRLSPLDEWYLAEALTAGTARDRERALGLIGDLELYGPALEEAVRRCTGDCDDGVRARARVICGSRGW